MKIDWLHKLPKLLKNNLELVLGVILSQHNHVLTIQRVKKEDSGLYTCTACNSRGCDTSQAFLTTEGQSLPELANNANYNWNITVYDDVIFPVYW